MSKLMTSPKISKKLLHQFQILSIHQNNESYTRQIITLTFVIRNIWNKKKIKLSKIKYKYKICLTCLQKLSSSINPKLMVLQKIWLFKNNQNHQLSNNRTLRRNRTITPVPLWRFRAIHQDIIWLKIEQIQVNKWICLLKIFNLGKVQIKVHKAKENKISFPHLKKMMVTQMRFKAS